MSIKYNLSGQYDTKEYLRYRLSTLSPEDDMLTINPDRLKAFIEQYCFEGASDDLFDPVCREALKQSSELIGQFDKKISAQWGLNEHRPGMVISRLTLSHVLRAAEVMTPDMTRSFIEAERNAA